MDDFDDIVLDEYDSYLGDKHDGNSDDPLATGSSSKKKRNQYDGKDDDPESTTGPSKKQRTKLKKLDHHVLMSPEGIPRLRNETPWLNFKDPNHTSENLQKLMHYYRSWAYKLYPRLNFTDFSSRVLKATTSKECKEPLKRWREEYIFKNSGNKDDTSLHDHTTGSLSGLTLEDEEKNSQISDDKNDSSNDGNSDHDDDQQPQPSRTSTSNDEQIQHKSSTDDDAWAAMMETDMDEDDDALFIIPPAITTTTTTTTTSTIPSTFNNNDLSVDDFFAD